MAPDGGPIEEKDCIRDLGVLISTDLSFSAQIKKTIAAGSKMAGCALRSFRRRGRGLMLTVMGSLVKPRLDYCSQLWLPSAQADINGLEDVQQHFVSRIKNSALEWLNYWEKLIQLWSRKKTRRLPDNLPVEAASAPCGRL